MTFFQNINFLKKILFRYYFLVVTNSRTKIRARMCFGGENGDGAILPLAFILFFPVSFHRSFSHIITPFTG